MATELYQVLPITNTLTGLEAKRTCAVRSLPRSDSSRAFVASVNSEFAIPRRPRGPDCLNTLYVTSGTPKRRHAVFMAVELGCPLVLSIVGEIRSFRNC